MKVIAAISALAVAGICFGMVSSWDAKRNQAVRILKDTHNVEVTSIKYAWFGCGQDDEFSFKWEGVNAEGKTVKGNACSGLLKGTTIRFK